MEADWSVEIGRDLPVIVAPWDGFVDLRRDPDAVKHVVEVANHPALAVALTAFNATDSPVFTSKCDYWPLAADEIDAFEFDASGEEAQLGTACYIDIIARDQALFASFAAHEDWVRRATLELRKYPQSQVRIEFVVRAAMNIESAGSDARDGFAVTLYVSACAATEAAAEGIFQAALQAATAVTMKEATTVGE